jgi:chromosome segregation ATPase
MARVKLTGDEMQERFKAQLEKAKEALQTLEARLGELDKEREKIIAKIKDRKAEVEKYQALAKERQYSVFEETLRTKGLNLEDVTKAIANGDTKYLLELTNLKTEGPEPKAEAKTEKTEIAKTAAAAPQTESAGTRNEYARPNYPPDYTPKQAGVTRQDTANGQAKPINITQYGQQAAAKVTPQGRNAAQSQT